MPKEAWFAHIAEDGRRQTLPQHLEGTARLCARFAAAFGWQEQGALAGWAHDIGKYSAAFQKRLAGGPKVDHATAGAYECFKQKQLHAAFAIIGHHSGLPDLGSQGDTPDSGSFWGRLNRARQGQLPDYACWQQEIELPNTPKPASLGNEDVFTNMFFVRMLFSCLTDADFLDTEAFMQDKERSSGGDNMARLEQRFLAYASRWLNPANTNNNTNNNALNTTRSAILKHCLAQGPAHKPGLFTLTVPTGGGKTTASLAFALSHARAAGMERIIYVIPYTSIIEQNATVFRRILGNGNVLEHHCGVIYDTGPEATPETIALARAAENWDKPLIVTTAVQFFESLYTNRPAAARKLHNIANSVIIFDEAQMLPLPYLRPCIAAIAQLVRCFGASAVLCTATQPALNGIFAEFLPETSPLEICPKDIYRPEVFRRVHYRQAGKLDWPRLAAELNSLPQTLCILNSRQNALEVFRRLEPEGAFHLSTLMYPAHRRRILEQIRQRLTEGLPCRVAATSLIEAGVDIDFPHVWREEAGLDSLIQAAGRCNREGKLSPKLAAVTIFQAETRPPALFAQAIAAARQTLSELSIKENGELPDLASPQTISRYFQELLELKGPEALDAQEILKDSQTMAFAAIAQRFRLIDSPTRTVYIPLDEGEELVQRLRRGERSRSLFRRLELYSVSVYAQHFLALYEAGDIELVDDQAAVLLNTLLYDSQTGLSLKADNGKALFI